MLPTLDHRKTADCRFDALMTSQDQFLEEFRSQITRHLQQRDQEWERSRRLLEASQLASTLHRLIEHVRASDLSPAVQDSLLAALNHGKAQRIQDLSGLNLRTITGLPPSKALCFLCVYDDRDLQSFPTRHSSEPSTAPSVPSAASVAS